MLPCWKTAYVLLRVSNNREHFQYYTLNNYEKKRNSQMSLSLCICLLFFGLSSHSMIGEEDCEIKVRYDGLLK